MVIALSLSILGLIGRINFRTVLTVTLLIFGFILVVITTPKNDITTFHGKIARSVSEQVTAKYKNYSELNLNWRGYETYRAFKTYISGNAEQLVLGQGFGSLVDLGLTMKLAGIDYKKIPILHNGYAYVLVKTGIIGLILYIFFYFNLITISLKRRNSIYIEQVLLSRLLLGCTLSLMLAMFVVGGMAEIHNSEYILLIGLIKCRMDQV
jgi:hypothetical protein